MSLLPRATLHSDSEQYRSIDPLPIVPVYGEEEYLCFWTDIFIDTSSKYLDMRVGDHLGRHDDFVPVLLIGQHAAGKLDPDWTKKKQPTRHKIQLLQCNLSIVALQP